MGTLFALLAFVAFCIFMIKYTMKKQKELRALGFTKENHVINVKYSCGHPDIDKPDLFNIGLKDNSILFLSLMSNNMKAVIPGTSIKNIAVEDESTFRRRVTLTRMLLVGVFAFALKKKKKDELAYVTIEWNDSRFDHQTVLEFTGTGSLQKANELCNKMMRSLRT